MSLEDHQAETVQTMQSAMIKGKAIQFEYDGLPRVVEAHAIGYSRTGRLCFRGFQIDGESKTGLVPEWRLFLLDKMVITTIAEVTSMAPREGYVRGDKGMLNIIDEL